MVDTLKKFEPPTPPTNMSTGSPPFDSITLTWDASSSRRHDVAGYKVYRDGVEVGDVDDLFYIDTPLSSNTTFYYTVRAYDNLGRLSSPSLPVVSDTTAAYIAAAGDWYAGGLIHYQHTTGKTSTYADGSTGFTVSVWVRPTTDNTFPTFFAVDSVIPPLGDSTKRLLQFSSGQGDITVNVKQVPGTDLKTYFTTSNKPLIANQWNHILVAIDQWAPEWILYVNDVRETTVSQEFQASATLTWTNLGSTIGIVNTGTSSGFLDGDLAEVWYDDTFIDISIEANRRKFITADGKPESLSLTGSLPTGSQPRCYLRGGGAEQTAGTNSGTEADWDVSKRAIPDSTNTPVELP